MTREGDVLHFLDCCFQIEKLSAGLYHFYADHFGADPQVAAVWRKTAREEENHAEQINLARKLPLAIEGLRVETAAAEEILGKMRQLVERVRQSPPPLREALASVIRLEERLAEFHVDNSLLFRDDAMRGLFAALMKHDHEHVETLRKTLESLESPPAA